MNSLSRVLKGIHRFVESNSSDSRIMQGITSTIASAINFVDTFRNKEGEVITQDGIVGRKKTSYSSLLCKPPCYTEYTDMRSLPGGFYYGQGIEYTTSYINYGKMVLITPGVMKSNVKNPFGDDGEGNTNKATTLANDGTENPTSHLDFQLDENVINAYLNRRMFGFESKAYSYWKRVEILIAMSSGFLNLDDNVTKELNRWSRTGYGAGSAFISDPNANGAYDESYDAIADITGKKAPSKSAAQRLFVPFYVDGQIEGTDFSVTNSTGESMYSNLLNNDALGKARELQFMTGTTASGISGDDEGNVTVDHTETNQDKGFFSKLFSSIVKGGTLSTNIAIPKVYSGSTNSSPSYTMSFTATSASGNKYQIQEHVLIPLFHILPLALPVTVEKVAGLSLAGMSGPPPVIRVFSKGEMNVRLGLITNINIQKDKTMQTKDGLYKSIKVTLTIEDLFPDLHMMQNANGGSFFSSLGLPEMVSNLCGYNLVDASVDQLAFSFRLGSLKKDSNGEYGILKELTRDINIGLENLRGRVRSAIIPRSLGGRGEFEYRN